MTTEQPQQPNPDELDYRRHVYRYGYTWFAFFQGQVEGRNLKDHHLRDATAFGVLRDELDSRGYRFVDVFLNGPAKAEKLRHYEAIIQKRVDAIQDPRVEDIVDYDPVDESFLGPDQLLVVSTRVPMNDFQQGNKVQVQPGFTSLEQKVIRTCRPYLPFVARSRVRIADALASRLRPEFADRAQIEFRAYTEPWYTSLCSASPGAVRRRPERGCRRTAAYLLYLPKVPLLNGADLLVMWGQGGTQTLAFAQLLRTDLSYLLDQYGFSMVEMVEPEPAGTDDGGQEAAEPLLSARVRDVRVQVLLEGVLLDAAGERVVAPRAVPRRNAPEKKKMMKPVRRGSGRRSRRSEG